MDGGVSGGAKAPPPAGRGVKGQGAALLAAIRNKNRRPGEAGNQGQPTPTETSSNATQSPLDTSVQSTATSIPASQGPGGRGALLIWALSSRLSSATSVTFNTAAVRRQALLERLKIKSGSTAGAGGDTASYAPPPQTSSWQSSSSSKFPSNRNLLLRRELLEKKSNLQLTMFAWRWQERKECSSMN